MGARRWVCGVAWMGLAFAAGCEKDSPTGVTPPTATALTVSVAGGGTTQFVALTQTKQFAATAQIDGASQDVTNLAVWQSSDVQVATVSPEGLVTAVGFGSPEIRATYGGKTSGLGIRVVQGCLITLTPPTLTFSAFGVSSRSVAVAILPTNCRWRVDSDAAWLPLNFDPNVSGNGTFNYPVAVNNSPADRTANLVVRASDGSTATHAVRQEKPATCSLVLSPLELPFPSSGGRGSFTVTPTPQTCAWTAAPESASTAQFIRIDQGASGTGNGTVVFDVALNGFTTERTHVILVRASADNPPARFSARVAPR